METHVKKPEILMQWAEKVICCHDATVKLEGMHDSGAHVDKIGCL